MTALRELVGRFWGSQPLERFLGAYQLFGGLLGLAAVLDVAPELMRQAPSEARPSGLVLWLVAATPLVALVLAGATVTLKMRVGVAITIAVQAAQVLFFSLGPISYLFFGGFYVGAAIEGGTLTASFGWQVYVELGASVSRTFIGVNVVPLVILALMFRSLKGPESTLNSPPFGFSISSSRTR